MPNDVPDWTTKTEISNATIPVNGPVTIDGGQNGQVNVSTQTPPAQVSGSPFSYSTTSSETQATVNVAIPTYATTLGVVLSYTAPAGEIIIRVVGNVSGTVYYASNVATDNYKLIAVNGSIDDAITITINCGASASGTLTVSSLAGEGSIEVTNDYLSPVIVQGSGAQQSGAGNTNPPWIVDQIVQGSYAASSPSTNHLDMVVQGANSVGDAWDVVGRLSRPKYQIVDTSTNFTTAASGSQVILTQSTTGTIMDVYYTVYFTTLTCGAASLHVWLSDSATNAHIFDDRLLIATVSGAENPNWLHNHISYPIPYQLQANSVLTFQWDWEWNTPSGTIAGAWMVHIDGNGSVVI